jgi:hypothetical protein
MGKQQPVNGQVVVAERERGAGSQDAADRFRGSQSSQEALRGGKATSVSSYSGMVSLTVAGVDAWFIPDLGIPNDQDHAIHRNAMGKPCVSFPVLTAC